MIEGYEPKMFTMITKQVYLICLKMSPLLFQPIEISKSTYINYILYIMCQSKILFFFFGIFVIIYLFITNNK